MINGSPIDYRTDSIAADIAWIDFDAVADLALADVLIPLERELGRSTSEDESFGIFINGPLSDEIVINKIESGYVWGMAVAPSCGEVIPIDDFTAVAEPVLWKSNIELLTVDGSSWTPGCWTYTFKARDSILIRDLGRAVDAVDQTARFPPHTKASPTSVLAMLAAGLSETLVGLAENEWLDAKAYAYDFDRGGKQARYELALAAARFANHVGGLVVIGAKTRIEAKNEVICALAPIPRDDERPDSYRKSLSEWVYPPIDGLEVRSFDCRDGELVVVIIPPQLEINKPYLVRGGFIEGRFEGAMISIVRRQGDGTIPATPAAIHATLAAGRALLSRGVVPPE